MNASLLQLLRCPFCAGPFEVSETERTSGEAAYGILTCHCDQYPLVGGIPVLKKDPAGTPAEAVALIKSGHHLEALLALISPGSPGLAPRWRRALSFTLRGQILRYLAHQRRVSKWREQATDLLRDRTGSATACDLIDFYFRSENVRNYFGYRFSCGRYLEGLSFAASLTNHSTRPLLDLGCGCGHNLWGLLQQTKARPVIGVDNTFFSLYVAKHWIAPQAQYVCCEADTSLPFPDGAFSAAFSSDALHYFVNKITSIRELKRLTQDDGIIVLYWLRNALLKHPYAGSPLRPEAYRALVADMPHRLVADSDVLHRYLQGQGPALARSADICRLADEPVMAIVASHREDVFLDYGSFPDWPHAKGGLQLNPLFVRQERNGTVSLRRTFPSAFWEENSECKSYLPEVVDVSSELLNDMMAGKRTAEMERLIQRSVLLSIPERHGRFGDRGNQTVSQYHLDKFARVRKTLRVLPAIEVSVADHVWWLGEIASLVG
jgi:SAM-dependent methyltransferase/uncharacterized protein YbaR (Trm112 family)